MFVQQGDGYVGSGALDASGTFSGTESRRQAWRGPILWLIVCGTVLIAALMIGTAFMVYNFRERALANSERELENTVLLLARHFDQQLDDIGVVQQDIEQGIRASGITSSAELTQWLSGPDMHRTLRTKMSAVSHFGALNIFNADGTRINSSREWPAPELNIARRSQFQQMKSDPNTRVLLSDPLPPEADAVQPDPTRPDTKLALMRRLSGPNGEFLGVVNRGIEPAYFEKFFASLSLAEGSVIGMRHANGAVLLRYPEDPTLAEGRTVPFRGTNEGTFRMVPGYEDRLVSRRALTKFPLVIFSSITKSSALAAWREQTRFLIIAAALVTLVIAAVLTLIVLRLIEQYRIAQQRVLLEKQRLATAVDNMNQGLTLFDANGRLVVWNQRYIEMYGVSPNVMTPGRTVREIIAHRKEIGSFKGDVESHTAHILRQRTGPTRHVMETMDGRSIQIANKPLADGGWVTTHEDITERRRSDERIAHLAHYDALTDLPNRVLFRERLEQQIKLVKDDAQLAVFYIDIDEFKGINDSLGHPIGDELLKTVATRLSRCVRGQDFVARLGGDEFAVVQTGVRSLDDVLALVTQIHDAIRQPCECLGHRLMTDGSIGIAIAPKDGADLDQLLKNADLAMYEAKAAGRHTHRFFEPGMEARVKSRRMLELDLRDAVAERQFDIHYQPSVDVQTGEIAGCEALLRWHHPERGMISPADFIPVAEETGLINPIGEWVLAAACEEAATWPNDIRVAVNVSPVQLRSQTLALKITNALAASGLPAHRLEIEITEAVLIRDDEEALAILHQLRAIGVRIALDDFGVGYSSLSYLQRFPFDKIKIDRCFIRDITEPHGSSSIVQAVTSIATARNMTTTAEGVETEPQLKALRTLGCTEMQGFLFSAPKPAAQIRKLFADRRERAETAA